jgi:hypothetical protein
MTRWELVCTKEDEDLGAFLDLMGLNGAAKEQPNQPIQRKACPKAETSDWYKQGRECPF